VTLPDSSWRSYHQVGHIIFNSMINRHARCYWILANVESAEKQFSRIRFLPDTQLTFSQYFDISLTAVKLLDISGISTFSRPCNLHLHFACQVMQQLEVAPVSDSLNVIMELLGIKFNSLYMLLLNDDEMTLTLDFICT